MGGVARPNSGLDLGGFLKWGFGGPVSQEQRLVNQANEDKSTINLFGKTVKTSEVIGLAATAALGAAGIYAARSGMRARASTASLAASRVANQQTILKNYLDAGIQYRDIVTRNRAARVERASTNVRAARLVRAEAALRESNPQLAQAAGDRAYAFRAGKTIRSEMAHSDVIGEGRRWLPPIGGGWRRQGALSFPNTDNPAAGPHHQYTPVSRSYPGSGAAAEWLRKTEGYFDSYGRTGMERLVGMYPGGVPKGGWMRQPNLRKRTPIPSGWDPTLKSRVINVGEMADGPHRDRVVSLLEDATAFRNRSAWRLQGDGRTLFPKSHSWIHDPAWAPEVYQLKVMKAAEKAAESRARLSAPKKRIGKGK
jgi:hypothetical protein